MVRITNPWEEEYPLPELTDEERAAMEAIDINEIFRKAQAQLPIEERKCWKLTDMWGRTIKRFATKDEAIRWAIDANTRAEQLGVHMRYRVARDKGFDD